MLKLGIFRLEDFADRSFTGQGRFGRLFGRDRISLRLLDVGVRPGPAQVEIFEAIMRELRLGSGIFRTTFHRRFQNLDPVVNRLLVNRFPRDAKLNIHDWAASDCLTSAEWAESLFAEFPNATLQASDLTLFCLEVALPDGNFLILERSGEPLQYISASFLVNWNIPVPRPHFVMDTLVRRARARFRAVQPMLHIPESWLDSDQTTLSLPPFQVRKLSMIHPQATLLAARDSRFSIRCHSAFEILRDPADIIRSMNIYNPGYFPPERLAEGAKAIWSSLRPGGCWVVGRTWKEDPPESNVSVMERGETGFRLLQRHGEGSEIEGMILNLGALY